MLCMFRLKTVKCSLAEGNFHSSDKVSMYVTCEGNSVSALKSSRLPKIWLIVNNWSSEISQNAVFQ